MHDRALRREQVGERVADGHPATAAGVQRTGGVGRDELEVDPLAVEGRAVAVRSPVATTARRTSCSQVGAR